MKRRLNPDVFDPAPKRGGKARPKSLTIRLTRTARDTQWKREPLDDLLYGPVEALRVSGFRTSTHWLAEMGVRALCEQIILVGQISLPVEVYFTGMESTAPGLVLEQDLGSGARPMTQ